MDEKEYHASAPLKELVASTQARLDTHPERSSHLLPDLAVKMFCVQVIEYARAYLELEAAGKKTF